MDAQAGAAQIGVRVDARARGRRTSRPGCPSSTSCSAARARRRGSTSSSRSRPASTEDEVEAAGRRSASALAACCAATAHAAAAPLRCPRTRRSPPSSLETSDRAALRHERRLLGRPRRRAAHRRRSRGSSRSSPRRRARPPRATPRGHRPRARARGDLQGARRGARPGVPPGPRRTRAVSEKDVVRTEAAPAPFQGAPYSQAITANGFVFVSGQLALRPGDKELCGRDRRADRTGLREPARDPRGGGHLARPPRQDDGLPPEPRRLPA